MFSNNLNLAKYSLDSDIKEVVLNADNWDCFTNLKHFPVTLLTVTHVPAGDFSGPAESSSFVLGSLIPIMASVEQDSHQPLLLLLEECAASTTPELRPGTAVHDIIANKGSF